MEEEKQLTLEEKREKAKELLDIIQLDEREQRLYDLAVAGKKWCSVCGRVLEIADIKQSGALLKGTLVDFEDKAKGSLQLIFCEDCKKRIKDGCFSDKGALKMFLYNSLMEGDVDIDETLEEIRVKITDGEPEVADKPEVADA